MLYLAKNQVGGGEMGWIRVHDVIKVVLVVIYNGNDSTNNTGDL